LGEKIMETRKRAVAVRAIEEPIGRSAPRERRKPPIAANIPRSGAKMRTFFTSYSN
jgi:hypothetical protein